MMTTPIPTPPGYPLLGNLLDLQDPVPIHAIERLLDTYGPIIKINVPPGKEAIFVGSFELFDELCDETRFYKLLGGKLADTHKSHPGKPAGLFTQKSEKEEDWLQAHRILMPALGPVAIVDMFDEMHDISSQLVLRWARFGPDHKIAVTADFSRLTLDTIALCAMGYRFNSFYQDEQHPFVVAMHNALGAASNSGQLAGMAKTLLNPNYAAQIQKDVEFMTKTSADLVQFRRDHPSQKKDLLNAMINGKDPKTGKQMRDELIAANMQTFLIAGHETTSGLLSFAMYQLMKSPEALATARQEVDDVLGTCAIEPKHLDQLPYLTAILRETLRLTPTAPGFGRAIRPENKKSEVTIGGGKYAIPRDKAIICLLTRIQQDPAVWGPDATEFKPERMLDDKFEKLPKNAYKPFGTGLRACIGRAFAWQEAILAMAMILQSFDIKLSDPSYEMQIVQTLTIKPKDLFMNASLRNGITPTELQHRLFSHSFARPRSSASSETMTEGEADVDPSRSILILYGSNTGTCTALANKLALQCQQKGYCARIRDMDSTTAAGLPRDRPVVFITSSYQGEPPDNAARFFVSLENGQLNDGDVGGVQYAVFGCGHRDWAATYQRVPTRIDNLLAKQGARRISKRGVTDVSRGEFFGEFEKWCGQKLWPSLEMILKDPVQKTDADDVKEVDEDECFWQAQRPKVHDVVIEAEHDEREQYFVGKGLQSARVLDVHDGAVEVNLLNVSDTMDSGDLSILPVNSHDTIIKILQHFNISAEEMITFDEQHPVSIPNDTPIRAYDILRNYVEISQPITDHDVSILVSLIHDKSDQAKLSKMLQSRQSKSTVTLFEMLYGLPSTRLPFLPFLAMLPPMETRNVRAKTVGPARQWISVADQEDAVLQTYLTGLKKDDIVIVGTLG